VPARDHDGRSDHVGRALLAFGPLGTTFSKLCRNHLEVIAFAVRHKPGADMPSDDLAARYREKAAECLEAAGITADSNERLRLVEIANAYVRLAEHAMRWASIESTPEGTLAAE
jgi:hypothetical protein